MPRVDPLFQLIKALSKSEKRYFKLLASMQGHDKKYVLLFDAIDAQEVYDEAELKERYKAEKFVRQFSVAKSYLYALVMKSLRFYHSGSTTSYRLFETMLDIIILSDKRLTTQARKLSVKAAEPAARSEKFPLLLEVIVRRYGLDDRETMSAEGLERMEREQRAVLDQLSNLAEYGFLLYRVARLTSRGRRIRSQEELDALDDLMRHPLLRDEGQALSLRGRMRYHWIHGANHFARGERAESLRHSEAVLSIIESDPDLLPDHISNYVTAIANAMMIHELEGNMDGFQEMLNKLHTRAQSSVMRMRRRSREEANIFVVLYTHLLAMHLRGACSGGGVELIPEIERGMEKYGDYIEDDARTAFYHHFASACFAAGELRRALDYSNAVLISPEPIEGSNIYHAARLTNLVIHYELGNLSLLKHLIPSTERFLRSRNSLHRFERTVLDLLERLVRLKSPAARIKALTEARDLLRELEADPLEQDALRLFPYREWVAGCLKGVERKTGDTRHAI